MPREKKDSTKDQRKKVRVMTSTREKKSVRNHCGRVGEEKVRGMVGMKVRDREEKRKKVRDMVGMRGRRR